MTSVSMSFNKAACGSNPKNTDALPQKGSTKREYRWVETMGLILSRSLNLDPRQDKSCVLIYCIFSSPTAVASVASAASLAKL